jgi:pimeloyl-ACP methyl ester carboxylesterase
VIATAAWGRFLAYGSENVRFRNGSVVLAGTLYLPRNPGPHPAVVIIHGSGRETRQEYSFYAKHFARHGVAGLAYDKRGVGESSGRLYETDYAGYASDALAAVALLKRHADIDGRRIGLMGVSEGEWVGPLAAAQSPDVAFLMVTSAAGTSPAEQVASEIELRLRGRGYPDSVVRRALQLNERVFQYQRTGEGADSLRVLLRSARSEPWFADADDIPAEVYPAEEYAWWRSVMDFDAPSAWERVRVPVLVLKGGRDPMSPADRAKRNIEGALRRGGNDDVTFVIFPKADHALLEWPLGDRVPPPVFAEGYLDRLTTWMLKRSR